MTHIPPFEIPVNSLTCTPLYYRYNSSFLCKNNFQKFEIIIRAIHNLTNHILYLQYIQFLLY